MKYKNDMIEDMMKKGIDRETAEGMAETNEDGRGRCLVK